MFLLKNKINLQLRKKGAEQTSKTFFFFLLKRLQTWQLFSSPHELSFTTDRDQNVHTVSVTTENICVLSQDVALLTHLIIPQKQQFYSQVKHPIRKTDQFCNNKKEKCKLKSSTLCVLREQRERGGEWREEGRCEEEQEHLDSPRQVVLVF